MADVYRAPLDDMRFVLNELVDLDRLTEVEAFKTATPDLVDQVLQSAARFAEEVVGPLNQIGDQQGVRLENGVVRMPDGFITNMLTRVGPQSTATPNMEVRDFLGR